MTCFRLSLERNERNKYVLAGHIETAKCKERGSYLNMEDFCRSTRLGCYWKNTEQKVRVRLNRVWIQGSHKMKKANLKFFVRFPLSGLILSNSNLTSVTTKGPIINETATPREPQRAATAVAVVRCSDGNQVDERSVGAAWVTGPAMPFNSWPAPIDLWNVESNG